MPILSVVKRSRRPLFTALRRLLARPGLVGVTLERRQPPSRRPGPAAASDQPPRGLRQPLDHDGYRTWTRLGFVVVKVRALPDGLMAPGGAPERARRASLPRASRRRPRPGTSKRSR